MNTYSCSCPSHCEKKAGNYEMMRYGQNIVEIAKEKKNLSTLVAAVVAAGLAGVLSGNSKLTVLAPTNAAFDRLPAGLLKKLLKPENKETLIRILKNHVIKGEALSSLVSTLSEVTTLDEQDLEIESRGGSLFIDGAEVLVPDIRASNGVIHVIDKVLVPEDLRTGGNYYGGHNGMMHNIVEVAKGEKNLSTLVAAVVAAGLAGVLSGDTKLTVLAPTNAAFDKLPAALLKKLLKPENKATLVRILKNHVIKGEAPSSVVSNLKEVTTLDGQDLEIAKKGSKLFIDGAQVLIPDVKASNGVVHVIDKVLVPLDLRPRRGGNSIIVKRPNIVEIAASNNDLSTLVVAVQAAGLAGVLSGGKFTVLAPTKKAFDKLPAGLLEKLLKPENKETLIRILKNHVVSGEAFSSYVKTLSKVKSLAAEELAISKSGNDLYVDGAKVLIPDIKASNGVIHVIDKVLIPSDLKSKAGRCTTKSILPSLKSKK